ncbi:uncharacterized protein LOC111880043 [Lactuca sativa]|uniref:uncharacterized protein LOC111880043 n=1 Tax=Lactuca sativa TaxID=4236 RepID=UPI000CD9BA19|nr:uncharacterized protein LOC111880043 [Lactuca sativa]
MHGTRERGIKSTTTVQVTKVVDQHTCCATNLESNHRQSKKKLLDHFIAEVLARDYNRVYRGNEIVRDINSKFPINISYQQHNPGTVTQIRTDDDDRFEFVYITLGCSVQAFIKYCRSTLIIDGGHLNGEFKGTMSLAVTMDGQNQIMPVAYAICKSECTETWSWFLRKLRECIGNVEDLTFISDRAPSIVNDCVWEYLQNINPKRWARAHFPGNRYFLMTSNSAESINSMSRFARKMPILMLIEYFRATMQQWSFQKRNVAAEAKTILTPWAETIIQANKNACNNWMVRWQIDGLPCGHVIKVLTMNRYEDCSKFALKAYFTETLRKTCEDSVNPLPSPSEWDIPDDLMIVKPPIMERRQPGRPRNTCRNPSQGEHPIRQECST